MRPTHPHRGQVSKGTYIRTLGEDIGEALGCGGHLTALRRIGTGHFDVSQCVTLEALEAMSEGSDSRAAAGGCAAARTRGSRSTPRMRAASCSGLRRRGDWPDDEARRRVTAHSRARLLGTAHVKAGELIPGRLLEPAEIHRSCESNI